jgi:hypothetical protein
MLASQVAETRAALCLTPSYRCFSNLGSSVSMTEANLSTGSMPAPCLPGEEACPAAAPLAPCVCLATSRWL